MRITLQASAAAELDRQAREARAALASSQERCQALQAECSAHSAKLRELQSKHKVSHQPLPPCVSFSLPFLRQDRCAQYFECLISWLKAMQ